MQNFKITVNGEVYEVEVEAIGGSPAVAAPPPAAPVAAPPPAPAPAAPAAAPAPTAAPKPSGGGGGGGGALCAPMPGTILDVKVKVGDAVKLGDVLLILEAMKMENELQADKAGTVKEVKVTKGQAVNGGDQLIVIG
ncbi:MAG: biotin/lipoyl-binding protein [Desulfotomaculaceae bacterium]|nr:biotin/lipoyl-binding protein [Desulfotomaculaceae bacterium]